MPLVTLESGQKAAVYFSHGKETIKHKGRRAFERRKVKAFFAPLKPLADGEKKADPEWTIEAEVTCSETDQFSAKVGRQEATRRLLRKVANRTTKADRRAVIEKLCPEFFVSKTDRLRAQYERLKKIFEPQIKPVADPKIEEAASA